MIRLLFLLLLALAPRPSPAQEAAARFGTGDTRLLVRSTTDIAILRPVMERFAASNPDLALHYEQWGSNALFAQSRAACRGEAAPADAVLSSAVQQMVWLVNAACAAPYRSPATAALPEARRWRDELWGITTEPAVIVYNKAAIAGDEVPRDRFALLDMMRSRPDLLRGRIATYDIADSGLGFLFAHADSLEATTFGSLLEGFARIDAVATCCSAEIIRGVAEGRYLMAYNVLGSYVLAAADTAEVGMVLPEDYTLVLSRGYMIPKEAAAPAAATRLLEFLLSPEAQEMMARAGLVTTLDAAESGLTPSARRFIALSPALLVARDASRRAALFQLWDDSFRPETAAP
ncbi:ABC transporter substrate-binding protein [Allosediminivita pacifica]|uniref:Iron(III) transport system substrate-binding protein n=1 Tax=Allosediminivita pacifica TaxID=1267769 RepID=A0A2T6B9P0_9RHOB|nr:ABC transporter substrate-binding protein [Allosediminivita pacifica]PTX52795.1 iron(III) transport system substrate-binding protein [Allosediminivita pacifica]GGA95758.1 iron ABC transporter [Allosediminivita pacifica]